jgi:ribosomal protein L40E
MFDFENAKRQAPKHIKTQAGQSIIVHPAGKVLSFYKSFESNPDGTFKVGVFANPRHFKGNPSVIKERFAVNSLIRNPGDSPKMGIYEFPISVKRQWEAISPFSWVTDALSITQTGTGLQTRYSVAAIKDPLSAEEYNVCASGLIDLEKHYFKAMRVEVTSEDPDPDAPVDTVLKAQMFFVVCTKCNGAMQVNGRPCRRCLASGHEAIL